MGPGGELRVLQRDHVARAGRVWSQATAILFHELTLLSARITMNEDRFLLVKGIAGLGNRVFSALNGILYARLTGRKLLIDWSDTDYSRDGTNVFHRLFTCPSYSPTDRIPETDSVRPGVWRGHLHEPVRLIAEHYGYNPYGIRRYLSINLSKLDYEEDLLVLVTYSEQMQRLHRHFRGQFQELAELPAMAILLKLLREELIPRPEVRDQVAQFQRSCFGPRTVGVHARYSDYRVRFVTIIRRLNALLKRVPGLRIFLSTDNIAIKHMFEENYSDVVTTPHWYPRPGLSIHKNPDCPDPVASAIAGLVDLYLLAECDYLVVDTSSSFAYLASLLSRAPASNVVIVGTPGRVSRRVRGVTTRLMHTVGIFSWAFRLLPRVVPISKL